MLEKAQTKATRVIRGLVNVDSGEKLKNETVSTPEKRRKQSSNMQNVAAMKTVIKCPYLVAIAQHVTSLMCSKEDLF